jgi:hypothetical protein
VSWTPRVERDFQWRTDREIDVICALASLAGERMFFGGDNSAGVGGDLGAATNLVTQMLATSGKGNTIAWGMGSGLEVKDERDRQVERSLRELCARAGELLEANRWLVLAIANAMLQHRTITGEDIDAIYHGTRGPTVDGSWDHVPATRQRLEDFHAAAVVAHQAHEVAFTIDPPATPMGAVRDMPPPRAAASSVGAPWPPPRRQG